MSTQQTSCIITTAYVPSALEIKLHIVHPNELHRTQATGRILSKFLQ